MDRDVDIYIVYRKLKEIAYLPIISAASSLLLCRIETPTFLVNLADYCMNVIFNP